MKIQILKDLPYGHNLLVPVNCQETEKQLTDYGPSEQKDGIKPRNPWEVRNWY